MENMLNAVNSEVLSTTDNILYISRNYGWFPISDPVVKVNEVVVDRTLYKVNYMNGTILFNSANLPTDIVKASYSYTWADILSAFPLTDEEDKGFGRPNKPISISVERGPVIDTGLELGGGYISAYNFYLNIFAPNEDISSDVTDILKRLLYNRIQVIDFNISPVFLSDGSKCPTFNKTTQVKSWMEVYEPEDLDISPNPTEGSTEEEKGRTLIDVTFQVIN